jgi:hypothetical protein
MVATIFVYPCPTPFPAEVLGAWADAADVAISAGVAEAAVVVLRFAATATAAAVGMPPMAFSFDAVVKDVFRQAAAFTDVVRPTSVAALVVATYRCHRWHLQCKSFGIPIGWCLELIECFGLLSTTTKDAWQIILVQGVRPIAVPVSRHRSVALILFTVSR